MKKNVLLMTVLSLTVILISFVFSTKAEREGTDSDVFAVTGASEKKTVKTDKRNSEEKGKVLIAYFSLTGNTDKVAGILKDKTEADIFKIEPDFDYFQVKSREEMEELGMRQVEEGFRPELKNSVSNMEDYDYIMVGSPVWWYSVTPPVMSFLSQYDFTGKTVIPFCTCGSVYGEFFEQVRAAIPGAEILDGLSLTESELQNETDMNTKIDAWLKDLNLT